MDALTGARFVAAFHVLLFHYGGPLLASAPAWAQRLREGGYVAVTFFFVLSGFVLAHNHARAAERGELDVHAFWVNRFSRIYPVYLVALVSMVPLTMHAPWGARVFGVASPTAKTATFLAHTGLVQGWVPQLATSWNLPGWSVSAEAFFYLCFPLLVFQLSRVRRPGHLLAAMAALWLFSVAIAGAYLIASPDGAGEVTRASSGRWLTALKYNPLVRLPEFAIGVCLGRLYRAAPPARHGGALAAGAMAGIAAALIAGPSIPYPLLHNGLLVPLFAALVFGLAQGGGVLGRALASRPLVALGDASYALYILQFPLMCWLAIALGDALPENGAAFRAAYFLLAIGASLASMRLLERPAQRWLRDQLLPRLPAWRRAARAAAASGWPSAARSAESSG